MTADSTTATWRAAGEAGDAVLAATCPADDVVLISPLTEQFRFSGRQQTGDLLAGAFGVITSIRFHTEVDVPTAPVGGQAH